MSMAFDYEETSSFIHLAPTSEMITRKNKSKSEERERGRSLRLTRLRCAAESTLRWWNSDPSNKKKRDDITIISSLVDIEEDGLTKRNCPLDFICRQHYTLIDRQWRMKESVHRLSLVDQVSKWSKGEWKSKRLTCNRRVARLVLRELSIRTWVVSVWRRLGLQ